MNRDARIEIFLRCTHLYSNSKSLHHLARACSNDVHSDNLLVLSDTNQLILSGLQLLFSCWMEVVEHSGEARMIHFDLIIAVLLTRSWLGKTNGADLRVRKDNRGDVGVVEFCGGEMRSARWVRALHDFRVSISLCCPSLNLKSYGIGVCSERMLPKLDAESQKFNHWEQYYWEMITYTKKSIRQSATSCNGHWGQFSLASDVANGVDAFH